MSYTTKEIIDLMERASRLGVSVEVADGEFSLKIDGLWRPAGEAAAPAAPAVVCAPAAEPAAPMREPDGTVVKSPIVGTYYGAPAPDKPPFLEIGKRVKKGDVLFIVESMKLMNEVTSEWDGVVREILAGNGQAVEFGQPVLVLDD